MHACGLVHRPNLERHVVGAGCEQVTLWIPFDGVHLVGVTLEGLDWFIDGQLADVDALISRATGEARICLPVDIKCWRRVETKLLSALPTGSVPYYCGLVYTGGEDVVAAFVPLQCKDWALVLAESSCKSSVCMPDSCIAIVAARCQVCAITLQ